MMRLLIAAVLSLISLSAMADPAKPRPPAASTKAPAASKAPLAAQPHLNFGEALKRGGLPQCQNAGASFDANTLSMPGSSFDLATGLHPTRPGQHIITTVAGINYPSGNTKMHAVAAFTAAPQPDRCDWVETQIFPTPQSCDRVEKATIDAKGKVLNNLSGVHIVQAVGAQPMLLIPAGPSGCVLVSVVSHFTEAAPPAAPQKPAQPAPSAANPPPAAAPTGAPPARPAMPALRQ